MLNDSVAAPDEARTRQVYVETKRVCEGMSCVFVETGYLCARACQV